MKLVFLHLSDLHLNCIDGASPTKLQAVTNSLSTYSPFDGIVIIISGDVAASGDINQYKHASTFIGRLVTSIKERFSISDKNLKLLLVPGNHDIFWGKEARISDPELRALSGEKKKRFFAKELYSMRGYFDFSSRNQCFFTGRDGVKCGDVTTRKILHFENGYRVEANLVNTAPFSSSDDNGIHFLPEEALAQMSKPSEADLSIVVMHHSPDWFEFSQKVELEAIIAQRCSVAFYGHEHILGAQNVTYDGKNRIIQQAGGVWWQDTAPTICEYYAASFDSDTRKYILHRFIWNKDASRFDGTLSQEETLMVKMLNGAQLTYRADYVSSLLTDAKYSLSENISDYFVFPDLRTSVSKQYSAARSIRKMADLIAYITENKYVAIVGGSNSGKTTLLKMLFTALQSGYAVLYCGIDDITGRSQENILKELVQNTYGEDAYSAFQQVDISKRIILIDDIHRISSKHLNKFLRGLEAVFGTIIVATEETSQFDIIQMVKENINAKSEFKKITISHLYAAKRLELIQKIVELKTDCDETKRKAIVRVLDQCLNNYKLAFRTEIDFVVQFSDYYCTHAGELEKADATVFSKVFEASIERAIAPHLMGRKENSNDFVVALSEVAHYIHFNHEHPITAEHINQVIEEYRQYYGNPYLSADRFIAVAEASGLMKRTSSGYEYRFASKNHLAYFVAKALNRKFHDDGDTSNIEKVVTQSCFSINGDILMFLTYITDNVGVLRLLLSQATVYVQEWDEYDVLGEHVRYLQSMQIKRLEAPKEDQKEVELQERSAEEEANDEVIETLDIYDYDESKVDELNNQLIRATLQLKIIARNFSAFVSILPARDKNEYVHALYELPHKIFHTWAKMIDDSIEDIVKELLEWQESESYKGKKMSNDEIKRFFQEISLNTLLNLHLLAASYGANDNTIDYLSKQEFVEESFSYKLERLMFCERVDDVQFLVREAERMYADTENAMARNMILAILHHVVVHSDRMSDAERRRIASKYFPPKVQTNILIDRQKVLKGRGV